MIAHKTTKSGKMVQIDSYGWQLQVKYSII